MKRWGALILAAMILVTTAAGAVASYRGDYPPDSVLNFKFTTATASTGAATQLTGSPGAACYKDGTTSPTTNSVSILPDWNSITGLNNIRIDTSGNDGFFSEGSSFDCVLTAGTVGGTSVVGYRVVSFSIARNTANLWQIRTATVSTTTAQLGVNVVTWKGTDAASTNVDTNVQRLAGTDVRATRFQANAVQWGGTAVEATAIGVNVLRWNGTDVISTQVTANVTMIAGATVNTGSAQLGVNVVNWRNVDVISTSVDANVRGWHFTNVAATRVVANVLGWNGTDVISTAVAANVTQVNAVAVSTSSAQFGVNLVNVAGAAVNTALAQLGVSVREWRGTDVIATKVDSNLTHWRGTAPNTLTNGRVAGTSFAPRNTALAGFQFVVTDSTTHVPTAGLAIECTRSIDGGGFAAGTLTATASVSNGVYSIDFGAGDLNGGNIVLRCTAPGADDTLVTITTNP